MVTVSSSNGTVKVDKCVVNDIHNSCLVWLAGDESAHMHMHCLIHGDVQMSVIF